MGQMPLTSSELLLAALTIIFALPWLVWRVFRTDDWAPLVVVQIVMGILLGPGIAGALLPDLHSALFTPETVTALSALGTWAVMLFVFAAGVELDLHGAWMRRRETLVTASLALSVPMILGAGAAAAMLAWDASGWLGAGGTRLQFIAGVGMACAVTALPILVLLMERLALLKTAFGQRVLTYASLDDIALWGVLSLVLVDMERLARQGIFVLLFALAAFALRRLMPRMPNADCWAISMIWLAVSGLVADWSGLHFMVGAFLAGAALDVDMLGEKKLERFRSAILLALMPIFFLSTGLRTGWDMGGVAVISAAALLLVAAVGGKLLGVRLAGRILSWQRGDAELAGWLLQTKALIMIIFANILLDRAIISNASFTALLLMAVASTMLTMPFAKRAMRRRDLSKPVQPAIGE